MNAPGKAGDDDQHGVAEDVIVEHLPLAAALGAGGHHILLADFIEKRILGQQRHGGEGAERHRDQRQRDVPEIVEDFPVPGKLRPAVRSQPAQREDIEERAAGEQDDQQDREQKSRYRESDDDHRRGPGIELRAVLHRLADAERYRDQIGQQRHPDPERHRDRQLLLDQLQHADVAEIALAEIEPRKIPHHQRKAFRRRLVEAELLFQALDEFGIEPLRAAVLRSDGIAGYADLAARAEIAAAPGNPGSAAGVRAAELRDNPFHRPARRKLHHHKRDEQNPQQGRDHQQNAAGNVGAHQLFRLLGPGDLDGVAPPVFRRTDPLRITAAVFPGGRTGPNRRSGGWCDTIAAPNSGRRETPGRRRGTPPSDRRGCRRR